MITFDAIHEDAWNVYENSKWVAAILGKEDPRVALPSQVNVRISQLRRILDAWDDYSRKGPDP